MFSRFRRRLGTKRNAPTHPAFQVWESRNEPLGAVEARIHDGVPLDKLHQRADLYLEIFERLYPDSRPTTGGELLEIGAGLGYVMEAALRRYRPRRIVGLDIAAGMIDKARERLERDSVDTRAIEFMHYDGVKVPLPSNSFDFVYSVASLQHAPRPYCFRAMIEAYRLVKRSGSVWIHLLAYSGFQENMTPELFGEEVERQLRGDVEHWHHYYSSEELEAVLRYGIGAEHHALHEERGSMFICFGG